MKIVVDVSDKTFASAEAKATYVMNSIKEVAPSWLDITLKSPATNYYMVIFMHKSYLNGIGFGINYSSSGAASGLRTYHYLYGPDNYSIISSFTSANLDTKYTVYTNEETEDFAILANGSGLYAFTCAAQYLEDMHDVKIFKCPNSIADASISDVYNKSYPMITITSDSVSTNATNCVKVPQFFGDSSKVLYKSKINTASTMLTSMSYAVKGTELLLNDGYYVVLHSYSYRITAFKYTPNI